MMKPTTNKNFKLALAGTLTLFATVCGAESTSKENNALRTREFIVMGYQGIFFELRSGEGPYLRTLTELLHTKPDDKKKMLTDIRALSESHSNIMDFADQVVKLQSDQELNASIEKQVIIPSGPAIYSGEKLENALLHLTRGMKITVFTKGGNQFSGQFEEYEVKRLWMVEKSHKSFSLDEILALEAPQL